MYIYVYMCIYIYTNTYTHIHIHIYIHTYTYTYTYTCTYTYTYKYTYTYDTYIYIYIYIDICVAAPWQLRVPEGPGAPRLAGDAEYIGPNIEAEMLNENLFVFVCFCIVVGFTNRTDNCHMGSKKLCSEYNI